MQQSIEYPRMPMQIELYQGIIDIGRRLGISEDTLSKMKEDLHYTEKPTYPDGSGDPIKDMGELGRSTHITNIK